MQTGFKDLDELIDLEGSKLIILGSRQGVGKSILGLNIATNIAKQNIPVMIFNLETSKETLLQKIDNVGNIFICDKTNISIEEICNQTRKMKTEKGIQFVLIDYMQLIGYVGNEYLGLENQRTIISKMLKQLAEELKIPILLIYQLPTSVDKRKRHMPRLEDIKPEGLIENADVILFLFRDDYYNEDSEKKSITEIKIAKNKGGKLGKIDLIWLDKFNKLLNLERKY